MPCLVPFGVTVVKKLVVLNYRVAHLELRSRRIDGSDQRWV